MGKFPFLFSFLLFSLIVSGKHGTQRNVGSKMIGGGKGRIGAIVDCSSRIGKEQSLAMRMAVESFNSNDQNFSLVIRDSESDPYQAALAGKSLSCFEVQKHLFCSLSSRLNQLLFMHLTVFVINTI